MQDVLESAPVGNKYESLKQALLSKFVINNREKLNRFFSNVEMGHRKPSEYLQFLFANGVSILDRESILKVWSGRLPPHISLHLTDEITLENEHKLKNRADEIYLTYANSKVTVNSIDSKIDFDKDLDSKVDQLVISKLDKYTYKNKSSKSNNQYNNRSHNNYNNNYNNRGRSRSKSPSYNHRKNSRDRSTSSSRNFNRPSTRSSSSDLNSSLCFYHDRFRSRAHKCQPPCSWRERSRSPSGSRRVAFDQVDKSPSKN